MVEGGGEGGASLCPHHTNVCKNSRFNLRSYIFVSFQQIPFKLVNFTNFEVPFPVVWTDFC